jgi:hypothetical protein
VFLGPYFPPETGGGRPLPPPVPAEPGLAVLLLLVALVLVLFLLARELATIRRRPTVIVDEFVITWFPIDAVSMVGGAAEDELTDGRPRPRLPCRQRMSTMDY